MKRGISRFVSDRVYQCSEGQSDHTGANATLGIQMRLTPLLAAYSSRPPCTPQTARHSHPAICAITSPNSSSTADQISAEEKFAI